jgi:hypothetical protein
VSAELALVEHLDQVNNVATEYLRGLGPTEISVKLAIPRTRVMSLLADWRAMASSNTAIHERAREALAGADQQFSILISKAYEVMDESDLQGNLQSKTAAIKVIADIESKRLDALHRAGLLDNKEIAEELASMERKHELIINILKEIAQDHPDVRTKILARLGQINTTSEAVVLDA